jgi:hypothetical protein
VLDFLAREIREEKEIKGIQIGKDEFAEYVLTHKRPKRPHQKILRSDKHFQQSSRIQIKKSIAFFFFLVLGIELGASYLLCLQFSEAFLYISDEHAGKKSRKQSHSQ